MTWKYAWQYRRRQLWERLQTPTFWWTLIGVTGALVVWFFLLYLAIKHLDTSLRMHSTFCSTDAQRNRHILVIVLATPLFLAGMIGVIGEWMTAMDNRRRGRKNNLKPLAAFSVLMQVAGLVILAALRC
jgi:uncharacterized membrane-anchored protein